MRFLLAGLAFISTASFAEVSYTVSLNHDTCINVCVTPDDSRASGACLQNWGPIVLGENMTTVENPNAFNTYYLSPQTDQLWLRQLTATITGTDGTPQDVHFNVFGMNLWACDQIKLTFDQPVQITGLDLLTFGHTEMMTVVGDNVSTQP